MKKEITEFEKYQAIHNLCNPHEPLKGWINEDNFINIYTKSFDNISEALSITSILIKDNGVISNSSNKSFQEYDSIYHNIADSFITNNINECFEHLYSLVEWYLNRLEDYANS